MANIIYKINQGGTDYNIVSSAFCTCSTAAGTAAKVANLQNSADNGFVLATGVTIYVHFQYTNTASNPSLNVNGTGAKPIKRYGTTAAGTTTYTSWYNLSVVALTYDGNYWVMNTGIDYVPSVNNAKLTLNVGGQAVTGNNTFTANGSTNTTYDVPSATASAYGVIKVSSVNSTAVTVENETTMAGRYYPIELNSDGKAIVNVPWTSSTINNAGFAAKPIYIENGEAKQCTGLSAELPIPDYGSGIALGDAVDAACNPNVSIATSTGTNQLTLSHGSKYSINVNGKGFIFTMPSQYSLPLAASGTRGGVQIGYSASNANIPLKLSSEKGYVTLTGAAIKHAIDNGGDLSWTASSYTFKDGTSNESLKLDGSLMYQNGSGTTKMVVGNTGNMGIAGYLYQYNNTSKRAPWSSTVYNIEKVTALPASPDANTLYIIV